MGWMTELAAVYDAVIGDGKRDDRPLPPYHIENNAPLIVTLDGDGNFRGARLLGKNEKGEWPTCMPCTEKSSNRTSGVEAYPFCDKLEYVAADFGNYVSGKKLAEKRSQYLVLLKKWAESEFSNKKIKSVYEYVKKGTLVTDILQKTKIPEMRDAAGIEANNVFVRWEVEIPGVPLTQTWRDSAVHQAWIAYYSKYYFDKQGFCYVSGKNGPLAELHPAKIRNAGDSAKLISSNDSANYTFRGRFENADEACQVGVEISQKAHNALRWLIAKQGTTVGNGLTVVSWCSASIMAPQLLGSTQDVFGDEEEETEVILYSTAEEFAQALNHRLRGYYGDLSNTDKILIMGLNAASPGRMSIVLYREFAASDFCEAQEYWHGHLAWYYSYWKKSKEGKPKLIHTISAPSPMEIAKTAYGEHINDNIKTMSIKRLLACILDKTPIPSDMEKLCFDRATRLVTIEEGIREKVLETACAVIRYNYYTLKKEDYDVEWDKERKSRDYLFGSLLAIADKVESQVLYTRDGENKRETNAVRYMHRFSKYPASTWHLLYVEKLRPYFSQLKDKSRNYYEGLIQKIEPEIKSEDFVDRPLSPEFLLGYHSLQKKFWDDLGKKNADKTANSTQEE